MDYVLRQFKASDAEGVKNLILTILIKEYPFDKTAYSDSDLDKIAETYGGKNDAFFVIEESQDVVGTVGVKSDSAEDALLRRLFVDLKHRRKGYGSMLLDKAIEFARGQGYKHLIFRCTDRMSDAMNLCLKKGFAETESLEVSGFRIHKLEMAL